MINWWRRLSGDYTVKAWNKNKIEKICAQYKNRNFKEEMYDGRELTSAWVKSKLITRFSSFLLLFYYYLFGHGVSEMLMKELANDKSPFRWELRDFISARPWQVHVNKWGHAMCAVNSQKVNLHYNLIWFLYF